MTYFEILLPIDIKDTDIDPYLSKCDTFIQNTKSKWGNYEYLTDLTPTDLQLHADNHKIEISIFPSDD